MLVPALLFAVTGCSFINSNNTPRRPTPTPVPTSTTSITATPTTTPPVTVQPPTKNQISINEKSNDATISAHVGQIIELTLNNTYWKIDGSSDATILRQNDDAAYTPAGPPGKFCVPGGGCGTVVASFTALKSGTAAIAASRTICGEAELCLPSERNFKVMVIVE